MGRILQAVRRAFAALVFVLLLLYVGDVLPGILTPLASFLSYNQLVPALLTGSVISLSVILLFTLIFGRWYCSCLCPLGILQDGIQRLPGRKHQQQIDSTLIGKIRYSILGLSLILYFLGTTALLLIVDPWSVFGRLVTTFVLPFTTFINNVLATAVNYWGNYSFVAKNYHLAGISVFFFGSLTLYLIFIFSFRVHSRFWCSAVCPVGAVLTVIAKSSPVRVRIDVDKCVSCGHCVRACKTAVIDIELKQVNSGDCISCFNCLPVCEYDAISYGVKTPDRRSKMADE